MVCLWDIKTGVKQMQFSTGTEAEITCMAFDPTNRRLITGKGVNKGKLTTLVTANVVTGGRNGSATMWNFNNGAKLRSLEKMDDQEISDVVFTR